jgi:predicted metal-binding membrane protein
MLARFGVRNIVYVAVIALLIVYANVNQHGDPAGRGMDAALVTFVWAAFSLVFFAVNLVLVFVALNKRLPVSKPVIGCMLPFLSLVVVPLST